jgi:hypothetical protein
MRTASFAALAVALATPSSVLAEDSLDATLKRFNAARRTAPADVGAYMDRAEGCWHFAGEEAYDAARRAEIDRALAELKCSSLKAEEATLRRKYARSPAALAAIDAAASLE